MSSGEAFDAFYAARASQLTRHIYLSTGDLTRAQDCVQEAFARAWTHWDRLETEDPVAWVTTVAWHLAIRDWRRMKRELQALIRKGSPPPVPPPPPDVVAVQQALKTLPPSQRKAVVLHYFEDLPVREIAHILGVPEGTVKSQLSRGRDGLRAALDSEQEAI